VGRKLTRLEKGLQTTKTLLLLLLFTVPAYPQASVPESLETQYVYVDASKGSDSNNGSQTSPLRTVTAAAKRAIANNQKNLGTRVIINPGVYREAVFVGRVTGMTSAPMTFQAAQTGTAVISGSDVWTGWQSDTSNGALYRHFWPYAWRACAVPAGWPAGIAQITLRREMIFVNGKPMVQVLSRSHMKAGTFAVDEGNSTVYVWPPSGTNMSTAKVEVSVRPTIMQIQGRKNVVVRGLAFEHANPCINQNAFNVYSSSDILFEGTHFRWNNWGGLFFSTSWDITVQGSMANSNGGVGFGAFKTKTALFQTNESSFNNWRGAQGALYDWGMGGTKLMRMHGAKVANLTSIGNHAQGLWFDTDNVNVTVDGSLLSRNHFANLQVEANQGPITIQNTRVCYGGTGANILTSSNLTLTGNTFYSNGGYGTWHAQVFAGGKSGGRYIDNWETGQMMTVRNENLRMSGNVIVDGASGQSVFSTYMSGTDWSLFVNSLTSDRNTWYDARTSTPFVLPGRKFTSLSGWRSTTGQDWNSTFQSASTNCSTPAPAVPAFYLYSDKARASVTAGSSTSFGLKVVPFGFTGTVYLSAVGLPYGVSAGFSTASLSSSGNSILTFRSATNASAGTFPITVYAVSGNLVQAISLSLTVVR
jgi:hypothetical protein